jgi:prepilin-type processing-associated H-X9-DG protein
MRRFLAALSVIGLLVVADSNVSAAPVSPLDRVPTDAGLFAHLSAGNLWEHPAVATLRKFYAKDLEKVLKEVEKHTGLRPEQIESVTFHFPKFPQGPGDQRLFVLQVVTKTPYDKNTLLTGFRLKDAKVDGDVIKLDEKMVAHLTSETQFTVTHETLLDEFKKGPAKTTDGVMKDAIQAAKAGKNALVVGLDPSGLPAEIFDNAPAEFQPFLPLLKSKSIVLQVNLDSDLRAEVRFNSDNEDKAIEAERAFNLLMKLADDGITTVIKEEKIPDELKSLIPSLTKVQKVIQGVKAVRQGTVVTAKASITADAELAKPIVALVLKPQMAAARSQSANNLKQIGLALYNYHDLNGVFPAAAIVDKKGKPLLSWRVAILPFIDQNNLYKQFHLDEPWDSEHNKKLAETVVKVYQLPYGESKPGYTHYRGFVGNGAAFEAIQGTKIAQFTDGTSNTLFVVEAAEGVPWTKPDDIEFDPAKPMLKHLRFEKGRCNILMCDGSVRAVSEKLTDAILKLLIQRDDGQVIPDFD